MDNNKHTIDVLSTGQSVGEISLIDESRRSASVRAKTKLKLIVLQRGDTKQLNKKNPALANKVLMGVSSLTCKNLHDTNNYFAEQLLSIC
ncbi:MAG: hypothetical protein CMQ33_03335 [Gammaproteobacteria bacterium]|nr:hypothetical protein [Gammaproteobacteria bacterium]